MLNRKKRKKKKIKRIARKASYVATVVAIGGFFLFLVVFIGAMKNIQAAAACMTVQ